MNLGIDRDPRSRRTFLVGLGRFMAGATLSALVKPPVLYSFPSEIRIATPEERKYVWQTQYIPENLSAFWGDAQMAYTIRFVANLEEVAKNAHDHHGGARRDQNDWQAP